MTEKALQPLRVGVVGLGWAGETHLKAYQQIPGVQVVAVSDTRPEVMGKVQIANDVEAGYENWQDLVDRPDIDVVSVATPNFLHMPVAVAALESGKHVLTEKPIARNATEGQAMVEAAEKAGRVLQVSFNHRKRGDVEALKHMIDAGMLGSIYYAKTYWLRRRGVPHWGGWFAQHELAGGGPLIDIGVHMLDMTLYLLGEPEVEAVSGAVYAELAPRGRGAGKPLQGPFDVEDLSVVFVRLAGGVTLFLEASWAGYGQHMDDFGVELFGTDAGAFIDNREWRNEDTLRIYQDLGGVPAVSVPRVGKGEGHLGVVRDFIDVIRGGDWAGHTGRDGLKRARIIEAAYRSAREGAEIRL
jgi:predicted dehydrogenase